MTSIAQRLQVSELAGAAGTMSVAVMIGSTFMLSTTMTPLYGLYGKVFGFGELTVTLIYATYVVGNLAALLLLGRLSDTLGRRRVALAAIGVAGFASLLFLFARDTAWLFWGRAFSGLGIGLAAGAGSAWLTELSRNKAEAAVMLTATNFLGLAIGAALAGLLAQYAPWPRHLIFVVYLFIALGSFAAISITEETVSVASGTKLSLDALKPRIGVPAHIRGAFIAPAVTIFDAMSLVGFYAALIPSIMAKELDIQNLFAGGAVVGELCVAVAATVWLTARIGARPAMLWGLGLILPAAGLLVWAEAARSLPLLLVASAIAGVSAGLGYRGSLQVVNQIAPEERRAEVSSAYFVAGFVGNALPVIGVGVLTGWIGSLGASTSLAVLVTVLAIIGLVVGVRSKRAAPAK
jgi:MFS family permease